MTQAPPRDPEPPVRPRRTISGRISAILAVSIAVAVGSLAVFSVWFETLRYAETKRDALTALAHAVAASASSATASRDEAGILATLRAIARAPRVVHAVVLGPDGELLAEIGSAVRLSDDVEFDETKPPPSPLAFLGARTASVKVAVVHGGRTVGTLAVVAETTDLAGRLLTTLAIAVTAAAAALALGLAVSFGLRRAVTRPIGELIGATRDIASSHDYRRTIATKSDDELGILVDSFNTMIGEIRARDARLERHLAELEDTVAVRTRDLRLAKESAEAANAAKSDFLATMSHEIRTPLNGMLVMAELLGSAGLADPHRRYAEVVVGSGRSLLAIINDILDLSKIEAGKLDVQPCEVDTIALADSVVLLFGERARAKGLDLAVGADADVPATIVSDPVRLGQVLANLVNNALKFTERGGVTLKLSRAGPEQLSISVADTGIGIAADQLGSIFDAFTQVDQKRTRRFEGTGLGLAITRRILDALGGAVSVESRVGKGSIFTVTLPAPAWAAAPAPVPVASSTARPRALVAVAGAGSARMLAGMLTGAGFVVECADSPEAAEVVPDLVIAEGSRLLAVPGRMVARRRAPTLVAVDGLGDSAGGLLLGEGRADHVLRRPVAVAEMRRLIAACLAGEAMVTEPAADATGAARADFSGNRVLVVDDSAVNREVAVEALGRFGIAVHTAESGEQAFAALAGEHFDLVFMDASMPELDGYETTRRIRAAETESGLPATPILCLTAQLPADAEKARKAAGMDGVLAKPFTLAAMEACLTHWLSRPATESTPMRQAAPEWRPNGAPAPEALPIAAETLDYWRGLEAAGRGDFVERIRELYREHGRKTLTALDAAAGDGRAEAIVETAHALKSMSANMGAHRVAALAATIENATRAGAPAPEAAALACLAGAFAEVLAFLDSPPADSGEPQAAPSGLPAPRLAVA